jgi:single-stranded-DNA-specific exonuclease
LSARFHWIDPEPLPTDAPALDRDPLVNALLWRRGVRTRSDAIAFLSTRASAAPDPGRLPNLPEAAARIQRALEQREKIAIFGDYDVDGITATALLMTAFHGATLADDQIIARLPRRDEGYGLNVAALDEFAAHGVDLLIAVDCGSTDHEHVAAAIARGMDVVIIDHHQMDDDGPAGAITVSARLDPAAPYQECCSAALVYLLVSYLAANGAPVDGGDGRDETDLLDFVALGTIGDVAPLTGVNRAFVRDGVQVMRRNPRWGFRALCAAANIETDAIETESIPFKLTPRLNAAGRLGDPRVALDLMLAADPLEAHRLAGIVESLNQDRRALTDRMSFEAEELLRAEHGWEDRPVFVLYGADWHPGLLGILAGRFSSQYGRPVVVLSGSGEFGKGSARSVPGFDIMAALAPHREAFTHFGGHSQAAGLTLPRERIADLAGWLEAAVGRAGVAIPMAPSLQIDLDLAPEQLTLAAFKELERAQPFGEQNPRPIVRARGVLVQENGVMGSERSHLRLALGTPHGSVKAVYWGAADRSWQAPVGRRIDIVGVLQHDTWRGSSRLQIELKDFA